MIIDNTTGIELGTDGLPAWIYDGPEDDEPTFTFGVHPGASFGVLDCAGRRPNGQIRVTFQRFNIGPPWHKKCSRCGETRWCQRGLVEYPSLIVGETSEFVDLLVCVNYSSSEPTSPPDDLAGAHARDGITGVEARILRTIGSRQLTEAAIRARAGTTVEVAKALRRLKDQGLVTRSGGGRKGDPFLYQKVLFDEQANTRWANKENARSKNVVPNEEKSLFDSSRDTTYLSKRICSSEEQNSLNETKERETGEQSSRQDEQRIGIHDDDAFAALVAAGAPGEEA